MSDKTRRFGKKQLLIGACIAAVLAMVVGGWFLHMHQEARQAARKQQQLSKPELQNSVDKANAHADYNTAINTLKAQANQDAQTQVLLADAYANKGDYKNALTIFASLDKIHKLPDDSIEGAAEIAVQAKDYQAAIHYYQEAKDMVVANKDKIPNWSSFVQRYDVDIQRLQKS